MPMATSAKDNETYKPLPRSERSGIGLSLSGGGYRAALFHSGALRRLNELGILSKLRTISSVSGGSIISAHLATKISWPLTASLPNWEQQIAKPFRAFCSRDIRTKPILGGLLPWRINTELLEREYWKYLTRLKLTDLPASPNFVFCATDLTFGVNWIFQKNRVGDYQAGYLSVTPSDWPLSLAVAASSCFPPIFKPLSLGSKIKDLAPADFPAGPMREALLKGLRLSDGGVYDNLGLEPIWKDHEIVLSSDGGALFDVEADKNVIWEIKRYFSIPENQALALRKRWLISNFNSSVLEGTYWGIGSSPSRYGVDGGYSKQLAREVIARIRTDLDAFSEAEAAVLENHGYLLADAAISKHVPSVQIDPIPPVAVPHPEWVDEAKVRTALARSSERKILGHRLASSQTVAPD